jgi:hypothetical protein
VYYKRDLETELGLIRGIAVPRARDGGCRPSKVFRRYKRRQEGVNRALREEIQEEGHTLRLWHNP